MHHINWLPQPGYCLVKIIPQIPNLHGSSPTSPIIFQPEKSLLIQAQVIALSPYDTQHAHLNNQIVLINDYSGFTIASEDHQEVYKFFPIHEIIAIKTSK